MVASKAFNCKAVNPERSVVVARKLFTSKALTLKGRGIALYASSKVGPKHPQNLKPTPKHKPLKEPMKEAQTLNLKP